MPGVEHVYGFQRDSPTSGYKIAMFNRGESPLKGEESGLEVLLKRVVAAGTFTCTPEVSKVTGCDTVTFAILKPFKDPKDLLPDFTALIKAIKNGGRHLIPGTTAAVNQVALYCEAMGINVYDVRAGIASLKGKGISRAFIWPGFGDYCLTKDTYYQERGMQHLGLDILNFPDGGKSPYPLGRGINNFMPAHTLHLKNSALAQAGKNTGGAKIALLGEGRLSMDNMRNTLLICSIGTTVAGTEVCMSHA